MNNLQKYTNFSFFLASKFEFHHSIQGDQEIIGTVIVSKDNISNTKLVGQIKANHS